MLSGRNWIPAYAGMTEIGLFQKALLNPILLIRFHSKVEPIIWGNLL